MIPANLRKLENLHILIWLIKDTCWVQDFRLIGMLMVFPTLILALWIAWKTRSELTELAHNLAVCCWISANSIWMTGEFYYKDQTRPIAIIFFGIGLTILLVHYCIIAIKKYRTT